MPRYQSSSIMFVSHEDYIEAGQLLFKWSLQILVMDIDILPACMLGCLHMPAHLHNFPNVDSIINMMIATPLLRQWQHQCVFLQCSTVWLNHSIGKVLNLFWWLHLNHSQTPYINDLLKKYAVASWTSIKLAHYGWNHFLQQPTQCKISGGKNSFHIMIS
jgi:hypothetical protein